MCETSTVQNYHNWYHHFLLHLFSSSFSLIYCCIVLYFMYIYFKLWIQCKHIACSYVFLTWANKNDLIDLSIINHKNITQKHPQYFQIYYSQHSTPHSTKFIFFFCHIIFFHFLSIRSHPLFEYLTNWFLVRNGSNIAFQPAKGYAKW